MAVNPAVDQATPMWQPAEEEKQKFTRFFRSLEDGDRIAGGEAGFRVFKQKGSGSEYYSAFGDNAMNIARWYFSTTGVIKHVKASVPLAYVTFSANKFSHILRDLLVARQSRVQIYEGSGANWKVVKSGSPGNLQDFEDLVEIAESAPALALKLCASGGGNTVGVAFAEAAGHVIYTCDFQDDEQFSNLEALLIQNGVKEVIHSERGHSLMDKMIEVFDRTNVVVTERKPKDFSATDIEQDLRRLLGDLLHNLPQLEQKTVMSATSALIKYLDLLSDDSNCGGFKMHPYALKNFMRLDTAVVRALNLLPQPNESQNRSSSVFGLLNQCKTAMGSRLLSTWLKQPLLDVSQIGERHDIVDAFVEDQTLRQSLNDECLRRLVDIRRYVKKFQRGGADLRDLVALYEVTSKLPNFIACLSQYDGPHAGLLKTRFIAKLENYRSITTQFSNMVETAIDMESLAHGDYFVRSTFDEELEGLKEQLDTVRQQIEDHHRTTARHFGIEQSKLGLHEKFDNVCKGWVFRLTQKQEQSLRHKLNREDVLQANKQGAYFSSAELRAYSKTYSATKKDYERSQKELVEKVIDVAKTYTAVFQSLEIVIAELDVLLSFATTSVNAPTPYVRPVMKPLGAATIEIVAARHPCVEVVQEDRSFIGNDVSLRRGGHEAGLLQIITGPNMGGKSTYIRQVGVILLMAQIGCFVPADEATLSVVDCILARVGAGDSQLRGVSTFMSEMLETAAILRTATSNSFIIVDELGRGTSTYDGFGLAWAIAEYLAQKIKAPCMFATHFHELTDLAAKESSVQNLHVKALATGEDITFLYKVEKGSCDQSFGIHVAKLAKFPDKVVEMAKRKASELEDFGAASGSKRTAVGPASVADVENDERIIKYLKQFSMLPLPSTSAVPSQTLADGIRALNDSLARDSSLVDPV